jgi:hypothetical protein
MVTTGVESIVNRNSHQTTAAIGLAYSTSGDRFTAGRNWLFWYLQRSKKVWFRDSSHPAAVGRAEDLLFCYDGRPILHCSELKAWIADRGPHPRPVVWGKYAGMGWGRGPKGANLYLHLWTRWTWLHPEACGHPERFSVVRLSRTDAGPS